MLDHIDVFGVIRFRHVDLRRLILRQIGDEQANIAGRCCERHGRRGAITEISGDALARFGGDGVARLIAIGWVGGGGYIVPAALLLFAQGVDAGAEIIKARASGIRRHLGY